MALFHIKWLRRLIRRNTTPIPEDRAAAWKRKLSIGYAILAWNAFGMVCFMMFTGKRDWADYYGYKTDEEKSLTPGQQFAKQFGMDNAKIIRVSGLKKIAEFEAAEQKPELLD